MEMFDGLGRIEQKVVKIAFSDVGGNEEVVLFELGDSSRTSQQAERGASRDQGGISTGLRIGKTARVKEKTTNSVSTLWTNIGSLPALGGLTSSERIESDSVAVKRQVWRSAGIREKRYARSAANVGVSILSASSRTW
jgi:hypothetical protein